MSVLRLPGRFAADLETMQLGLPGGIPQTAGPPPQAAAPPPISPEDLLAPDYKPGKGRKAWAAVLEGFGASPRVVQDALDPDRAERAQKTVAQRMALARRLWPEDPESQLLFATGNEDFMKSLAKNKELKTLADDVDLVDGRGKRIARNAKTSHHQDGGYVAHSEDGVTTWSAGRPKSHQEVETGRSNVEKEGIEREKIEQDRVEHDDGMAAKASERDAVNDALRAFAMGNATPAQERIVKAWEEGKKRGENPLLQTPPPSPPPPPKTEPAKPAAAAPLPKDGTVRQNGWVYTFRNGQLVSQKPEAAR